IFPVCETMMQPTFGLGALRPRAPSPSASASAISARSSLNPEPLAELLHLPLLFLLLRGFFGLILLLAGDDVSVSPVRRVELNVSRRRRRHCPEPRVDQELEDDDARRQQRQRGADALLAAAVPHDGHEVAERSARARRTGEPGHLCKDRAG